MQAIIFKNHINNLHGGVVDLIEYYLCILEYNKDIQLLIINYNNYFKTEINKLIRERYHLEGIEDYEKNISNIARTDLLRIKFDKVLILDYGTIPDVKGLIQLRNKKSKIIVLSDLHTDIDRYMFDKKLYPDGCIEFYGEMPFVYKDHQYNMKFLFDRYKPLRKVDDKVLVHAPESNDYSFIKEMGIVDEEDCIFKTHTHKDNFFELFNTFWYYHAAKWFDPRPRLIHENFFFGKDIIYTNKPNWKDGSYFRHSDLNENGLKNRFLNKKDEVVRQFI